MLRLHQRTETDSRPLGDCGPVLSALLRARGIRTAEEAEVFLHPTLDRLSDPLLMPGLPGARQMILDSVAAGERIMVYGDYDCDGVCAAAILSETLEEIGADAGYLLPDRHGDGYGLNSNRVRELAEQGCRLLITVDCGITNIPEVREAKALGMKVIVTDHHRFVDDDPAKVPEADAVIDPLLPGSPDPYLCGAGVALQLARSLQPEALEKRMEIAALATVADIVPLRGDNRVLVSEGLKRLAVTARPGLAALKAVSELADRAPTASDLGFRLGPRINAGGRLGSAMRCVRLLRTRDPEEAAEIAKELDGENARRKTMQDQVTRQAEALLRETVDFRRDRCIVVMGDGWESGIVGLAAGKLCEKYHWPVIVLSRDPATGLAVGSCRSIAGVNIHTALSRCADLFLRFGGHAAAAGLTMEADKVPELRVRLNAAIGEISDPACFVPEAAYDLAIRLPDVDLGLIDALGALEPTGEANPAPVFLASNLTPQRMTACGASGAHLRVTMTDGASRLDGIGFGMGHLATSPLRQADALFVPVRNTFRGVTSPEMRLEALRPSSGMPPLPEAGALFPSLLQEIRSLAENMDRMDLSSPEPERLRLREARDLLRTGFGTLVVCHDPERARELARTDPMPDLLLAGQEADRRGFCTLALDPDPARLPAYWPTVLLADGDLLPGEAAALRSACRAERIFALEENPAAREVLRAMRPTVDQCRTVYSAVLALTGKPDARMRAVSADVLQARLPLPREVLLTALAVLDELELIAWAPGPQTAAWKSSHKCSPQDAPLMRWLSALPGP